MAGVAALGLASLVIRTGLQVFFLTLPPSAAAVARVVPLDFDYRVFAFTLVDLGTDDDHVCARAGAPGDTGHA